MARYFLESLIIEGFRGINNNGDPLILSFNKNKVNSLSAPNGAGKSSVFEAIHFAIFGTVPRLNELQEAEQGGTYIVNRFHPAQQASIELAFASDDGTPNVVIKVTRSSNGARVVASPSGHGDAEGFLTALREDFILVDYQRFSKLIDTSALLRGRSFASLVGLSRYSRLRQALDGAKRTQNINNDLGLSAIEARVESGVVSLGSVERRIVAAYGEIAGPPDSSVLRIDDLERNVTTALASIGLLKPLLAGKSVMAMDFDAAENAVEREEGGDARKALDVLTNTIATLSAINVTAEDLASLDRLIALAEKRDEVVRSEGTEELHTLLRDALVVISSAEWHDPNICPVCDAQSSDGLKQRLETKVARYDAAASINAELAKATELASGVGRLRQLEEAVAMSVLSGERMYGAFSATVKSETVSITDLKKIKDRLESLEKRRGEIIVRSKAESAALQAKLPPSLVQVTRTLSFAKQFRAAAIDYKAALPILQDNQKKLQQLNRWKAFIARAAQSFADAESALANDRIAEVQALSQDLFKRFVRGGPDMRPTLTRAQNSENVDLKLADFFGLQNLSARALLSESYRNAVAASVFFAAAVKHSGSPRFIVLDDVTSSFDAGHQIFMMDAIRTQLRYGAIPDGLQFIILSHDTSLEKYFDRLNGTGDWHHQKLQGMPPKGRLMVAALEADRLKAQAAQYLGAGDVDIGATFLRQYLEYKLGHVITKLQIPVPPDYAMRGDRRTLSTYLDAITDAVSLYSAAQKCVLTPQQIADLGQRHAVSIMTNFVSHYETAAGSPFNAYALLGVLQSIDALSDCFTYVDQSGTKRFYKRIDRRN